MVRETRHLWVGNLPENVREEKIIEHFKRWIASRLSVPPMSKTRLFHAYGRRIGRSLMVVVAASGLMEALGSVWNPFL